MKYGSYFLHRSPSPTWYPPGTAMNNYYSSPEKISTHYIPWPFYFWIWFWHGFGPWGPSLWAPIGATCTIWTTLNPQSLRMIPAKFGYNPTMHFQEVDETFTFYIHVGPPPQPLTPPPPHKGPLGPPWELPWTTFILHLTRYLYTT